MISIDEVLKLKCEICGATFTRGNGSLILTEKNGEIGICPSCHDDVYQDGSRYDVDIMIVPVSEESFKIANLKKKYIAPSSHIRRRPKFVAFYRGSDIQAITHIARIIKVISQVSRSDVKVFLRNGKPLRWMDKKDFNIFEFLTPVKLRYKIVRNDSPPIQNRVYKTFEQFSKARKIKDLYRCGG